MDKIRWGILGAGSIAHQLAKGLQSVDDGELIAVGSRSKEKAADFAGQYGASHIHDSYEGLVNDADVDIIYVATPHNFHKEHSLLCIEHGKAALCEKPFTVNANEAREIAAAAKARQVFVMEAMWSRFLPSIQKVKALIEDGAIGEPQMLQADFCFRAGVDPSSRLFNPALAGGGLLDVGVYTISLGSFLFGRAKSVAGVAQIGETGVDEQNAVSILYESGQVASLVSAIRTNTQHWAIVYGTEGNIRVPAFWHSNTLTLMTYGKEDQVIEAPMEGNGYNYEVAECNRALKAGLMESPIMPLDESIAVMEVMDKLRAQWGLKYPFEK